MTEAEVLDRLARSSVPAPEGRFAAGRVVGDWRLTAFLARGGTAEVYCAEHVVLGVSAAVKILDASATEKQRGRFVREATILAELKSAAFPRFLAYGECEGCPYLVQELLEPRDLPATDRAVARYLIALCRGLAELHARGIVHCDLKPANILFRGNGEPVIVDLGLSTDASFGEGGGTPGYSAPEQFTGEAVTPAADIHALGVLASVCFSGRPPHAWRAVVRRATSTLARERYATVGTFARAVRWRHLWRDAALVVVASVLLALLSLRMPGREAEPVPSEQREMEVPDTIELDGRKRVLDEPLVIGPGRTLRVIGPGTLDAVIEGSASSTLWMTNCIVLNRAKEIFPKVALKYELTKGVYLNFTAVKESLALSVRRSKYILPYDGAFNKVRFHGPETLSELDERRTAEFYESLRELTEP